VCQVRYEEVLAVSDARTILAIHKTLGGRHGQYPKVEPMQESVIDVSLAPTGLNNFVPSTSTQQSGWRLSSDDGYWVITIMPSYVAMETSKYTTWGDDFKERLGRLIDATSQHISPSAEQRLGLRYVDRIVDPAVKAPGEWRPYIVPELLGPIMHEQLGMALTASQQQIDIDAGNGIRCSLRHGFFSDRTREGALTYLLDFDVYREGICSFNAEDIKATANVFHRLNVQLFQQVVTPAMLDYLA
jgi:uncharacterized protein (TIGR04255 family)